MTIRSLVISPDRRLNEKSKPVENGDDSVKKIVQDMLDTMEANRGIGLAAVQIGVMRKIVIIDIPDDGEEENMDVDFPIIAINPEITWSSVEKSAFNEGCLSFPEVTADVIRPVKVKVSFFDIDWKKCEMTVDGLLSKCFQHEVDHVNGITFVDRISPLKRNMIIRKMKKNKRLGVTPEIRDENPYI